MNKVNSKTVEYLLNNKLLGKYHNNTYVVVEFRVSYGIPYKSICNTNVCYDKNRNLIIGKCGSGITPESLALHTDYNNYFICKPDEVEPLFNEWKNLASIKEIRKRELQSRINRLLSELDMLENELVKI